MSVVNFDWTDEAVAALRKLVMSGLSASQIAAEMSAALERNFTRNAIIGKASRLHMRIGIKPKDAPIPAEKQKAKAPPAQKPKAIEVKPMVIVVEPPVVEIVIPQTRRVTIFDLEPGMCKFPIGDPRKDDFTFCGATGVAAGRSYCAEHTKIAVSRVWTPAERETFKKSVIAMQAAKKKQTRAA